MLSFEECKKILNKGKDHYKDEEIKLIMNFIDLWARLNAKSIINNINKR